MELFRIKKDIPFMKHALIFNVISFISFLFAVFFLVTKGLHLSVEFTGGTVIEVAYSSPAQSTQTAVAPIPEIRATLERLGYAEPAVQQFGNAQTVMIRLPVQAGKNAAQQSEQVLTALRQAHTSTNSVSPQNSEAAQVVLNRVEFVGPQVGDELARDGLLALTVVCIGIMLYLAMRFEWKFAVAAIVANLHDVIIILGFFAFFQWEFSLSVLAAVLAVLGYSVNESVVVFDRVRENFKKLRKVPVPQVIDNAITSTISRTMITHGSTQMMVTAMLLFGGPTLHYFALALTIGICFGIYSSVLVASPMVMWLGIQREDLMKSLDGQQADVVV